MSIIDIEGRILESSTGADLCCEDIIEKIKADLHPGQLAFVDDQDTQMALFDLVQDEQVNVGRSEFRQGDRIKDNGGMHSANILKNLKGNWDFDGVQKIGNDFYNADGEKMDNDDIEDFYYEQGYDADDNNVGVELGRPLPSDTKPPTTENLKQLSKITTRYNK